MKCAYCGITFQQHGSGRRKIFCDNICARKAHDQHRLFAARLLTWMKQQEPHLLERLTKAMEQSDA